MGAVFKPRGFDRGQLARSVIEALIKRNDVGLVDRNQRFDPVSSNTLCSCIFVSGLLGEPYAEDDKMVEKVSWRTALLHTTAIAAAVIVFAVVLTYTGNANWLFAIVAGFGAGLLVYLVVHVIRDKPSET